MQLFQRSIGKLLKQHCNQPSCLALGMVSRFLFSEMQDHLPNKGRNGNRAAFFRHGCRTGLNEQKAGPGVFGHSATVRRAARDPYGVLGRDKPECILHLTAHCAMQRQDQLAFAMIMRAGTRIIELRRNLECNRCLGEKV